MIFNQYQEEASNAGWYIFIDATCIAGPFDTKEEAMFSLGPEIRKTWIWDLGGENGRREFLQMPIKDFYIGYCDI